MRRLVFLPFLFAAGALWGAGDLDVARAALADRLWDVALVRARAAQGVPKDRDAARLAELEALAGAARPQEILARLDAWGAEAASDPFRYWRAWADLETGRVAEAREVLSVSFTQRAYAVRALRLAARAARAAGDRAAAEAAYAAALKTPGLEPAVRAETALEWARLVEAGGDAARAAKILADAQVLALPGPAADAARLLAARLAQTQGDAARARALWQQLLAGGTNTEAAAFVEAACRFTADATNAAARAVLSNAVVRAPQGPLARRARQALAFAQLPDAARRADAVQAVMATVREAPEAPESRPALRRLADALLALGDAPAAARAYAILLQTYPACALDAHVLAGRGWAFLGEGRRTEAVGAFARAAQIATNAEERALCVYKQGDALAEDGRFAEAVDVYRKISDASALKGRARFAEADALARAGRPDEAAALFEALFRARGPEAAEAGLRAAALASAHGRYEDVKDDANRLARWGAIGLYAALLAARPPVVLTPAQRARAHEGRARALCRAYRHAEAVADFEQVAKLLPARAAEMGFYRALCLYGEGLQESDEKARTAIRALAATEKDSRLRVDLELWLAKDDAERGEHAAALARFEACATNRHISAARALEALVRAGRCAAALQRPDAVLALLDRALTNALARTAAAKAHAATPWVAEAFLLRGETLMELARFDEAAVVFERLAALPVPPEMRTRAAILRADAFFAMGADDDKRFQQALEVYRAVLREEGLSPSARLAVSFKQARTLEKLARTEEAMDQYFTHVVVAYWDVAHQAQDDALACAPFTEEARLFFARAVFILADYYERSARPDAAILVLGHLADANLGSSPEARRRIARLKGKGN